MKARLRKFHPGQQAVEDSLKPRKIIRTGRRWGKTTYAAGTASRKFRKGKRVLYLAPTNSQTEKFWFEITRTFAEPIQRGKLYSHNTHKYLERRGTENRIKAKTAWNANNARGDYADYLILDEYHIMNEDVWGTIGAPMLMDNGGEALFIYTPPTLSRKLTSKATDKMHAAKFAKDKKGKVDWEIFTGTSWDNPVLSRKGLHLAKADMDPLAYRMEILAEDIEESPHALWRKKDIRVKRIPLNQMEKIVIGVDPSDYTKNSEVGIIVVGKGIDGNIYIINDKSVTYHLTDDWTRDWSEEVAKAYDRYGARLVLGETNFGGDTVRHTMRVTDPSLRFKSVRASRGKALRADPIAKLYKQKKIFHFGRFTDLEDQMLFWEPGMNWSPDRLDALVWGVEYFRRNRTSGVLAA